MVLMYKKDQDLKQINYFNMYKYKIIKEEESKSERFQQERIDAFSKIEDRIDNIKKLLRQAKIETIKVYREQPDTFAVIKPTDIINDYLKDIETLLK